MESRRHIGKILFLAGLVSLGIELFTIYYSVPAGIVAGLRTYPLLTAMGKYEYFIGTAIVFSVILLTSGDMFMENFRVHTLLRILGVCLLVAGTGLGIYGIIHPITVNGYGGIVMFTQPFSLEAYMSAFTGVSIICFAAIFGWAKRIDDARKHNAGVRS